tara:strand:- start:31 stop:435 length:405 start_codon:yes stop_codon:yes gene_type:complete
MTSQLNVDTIKGKTTEGSIAIQGEGSKTTNLQQGLLKAWGKWDASSTVTLEDSLNTTSITDNGTGDFEQNFTNNMSNIDYSLTGTIKYYHIAKDVSVNTTAMFPVYCYYVASTGGGRTGYDTSYISAQYAGDLA